MGSKDPGHGTGWAVKEGKSQREDPSTRVNHLPRQAAQQGWRRGEAEGGGGWRRGEAGGGGRLEEGRLEEGGTRGSALDSQRPIMPRRRQLDLSLRRLRDTALHGRGYNPKCREERGNRAPSGKERQSPGTDRYPRHCALQSRAERLRFLCPVTSKTCGNNEDQDLATPAKRADGTRGTPGLKCSPEARVPEARGAQRGPCTGRGAQLESRVLGPGAWGSAPRCRAERKRAGAESPAAGDTPTHRF